MTCFVKQVSSNNVGAVASYSCQDGYRIVGADPVRVCRVNGRWDPPGVPFCSVIDCGRPDLIPVSFVTFSLIITSNVPKDI